MLFYKSSLVVLLILLLFSSASGEQSITYIKSVSSIQLIEESYNAGEITLGDKIFYNAQAILSPVDLPPGLKSPSQGIIKSGTMYVLEAFQNWDILTPLQQSLFDSYRNRPPYDTLYISPEEHFFIHYDTIGTEAVPPEDLDFSGIPDYVERIGEYADSIWRHYHNTLDYFLPPPDSDSVYDIYLLSLGHNVYGVTVYEDPGDSSWNDYTSHIRIHCNFENFPPNDDPEGNVIGAQKVTCAHEYYHAVQMAYDAFDDRWWIECTAVFFEDVLFPEVNDNYNYISYFFDYPELSLASNTFHMYGSFIWPSFLEEKYNIDFLKTAFEYGRYYSALDAIDSSLNIYGKEIDSVFPEFTIWNYFTDDRADTAYHNDGVDYPHIDIDQTISSFLFTGVEPVTGPDGLASNYIVCYPDEAETGFAMFKLDGDNAVRWGFSFIAFIDGEMEIVECPTDFYGRGKGGIYDFELYDSVILIPCVTSPWLEDNNYILEGEYIPFGDVDYSGTVDILDILFLINHKYKSGSPPPYDIRMGDADCDELINVLDIIYLINYKYKEGPAPGPCRY